MYRRSVLGDVPPAYQDHLANPDADNPAYSPFDETYFITFWHKFSTTTRGTTILHFHFLSLNAALAISLHPETHTSFSSTLRVLSCSMQAIKRQTSTQTAYAEQELILSERKCPSIVIASAKWVTWAKERQKWQECGGKFSKRYKRSSLVCNAQADCPFVCFLP